VHGPASVTDTPIILASTCELVEWNAKYDLVELSLPTQVSTAIDDSWVGTILKVRLPLTVFEGLGSETKLGKRDGAHRTSVIANHNRSVVKKN
jgi:hypothetical protein